MPKSRGRKNRRKTQRVTKRMIDARTRQILEGQRQRFREKFGRDWQENDPVFFDPDASEPRPMSAVKMEADVLEAMRRAGTPPQIQHAYRKTGLILTEDMRSNWPADRLREWDDAIDEYFAIEDASGGPAIDPELWSTEIPELLASRFDQDDYNKVREILDAIRPIEGREPITVVARMELAAAFLATACICAYESAAATGSPGRGAELYAATEEIVLKRAREIYGQGRA